MHMNFCNTSRLISLKLLNVRDCNVHVHIMKYLKTSVKLYLFHSQYDFTLWLAMWLVYPLLYLITFAESNVIPPCPKHRFNKIIKGIDIQLLFFCMTIRHNKAILTPVKMFISPIWVPTFISVSQWE